MKKIITYSILALGIAALPQNGSANSAPHWTTGNIGCTDCHPNHMGPKTSCEFCHNNTSGGNFSKNSAPAVATHSAAVIGSTRYGQWERQCNDCHDPHVSAQCDTPLVEGAFTHHSTASGTTTFHFDISTATIHDADWQNPSSWNAKSGNERGLILLVQGMLWDNELNIFVDFSSEIISANATSITVQGEISEVTTERNFKIIYGQYIKSTIEGTPVSFVNATAGLALDESDSGTDATPNGVCQVCHSQTRYWRNDGTGASHFNREKCSICHEHEQGFRPSCNACHGYPPLVDAPGQIDGLVWSPEATGSTSAGAHGVHVNDNGISCDNCHAEGMPVTPVVDDYKLQMGFAVPGLDLAGSSYDGQTLFPAYNYEATNGTTVTSGGSMTCMVYCHSDGTSIATGILNGQPSPSWINGSTDCNSCHSYPPAYGQDAPKSNSHQRHIQDGFSCHACHYGTTTDSATIAASGNHGNGRYDIIGAPTFSANGQDIPLDLVYEFDAGGGTCSTNSCHGYFGFNTPIRWGNVYLYASPSILQGDESNEIDFQITVTDCGNTGQCAEPFTCSFDWGDGNSEENVSCTANHIYSTSGQYAVTWNVWDANNHSMENDKTNLVTVQEILAETEVMLGAEVDPATGIVTLTVPETTTAGVPVMRVYIYWGDRKRSVLSPPILPAEYNYYYEGTYRIKVVVYDANYGREYYTYKEEPSLEVTVVHP